MQRPARLQGQRPGLGLKLDFAKYKPKYRERNIYTGGGGGGGKPRPAGSGVSEDKLLSMHIEHLGYSPSFLGLHFLISYAVQALAQLGIVCWSAWAYATDNQKATSATWLASIITIDIIITIFLVLDLMAHAADTSNAYWEDWGNRIDALGVLVVLCSLMLFFNDQWRAEFADATSFGVRLANDFIRVLRIALFARRIRRAIRWDKESMGYAASRGHCITMEDACVVKPDLGDLSSFFAVYDGNNGNQAAEYCAKHLHLEMTRNKHFDSDPRCAMLESFEHMAVQIGKLPASSTCEATCVHIRERDLLVGWSGSSRAILCQERKSGECVAMDLTASETGTNAGALGEMVAGKPKPAAPQFCARELTSEDQFVVLASNGVWAVIDPQQAVELVSEFLTVFGNSKAASEELVDEALRNNADGGFEPPRACLPTLRSPSVLITTCCPSCLSSHQTTCPWLLCGSRKIAPRMHLPTSPRWQEPRRARWRKIANHGKLHQPNHFRRRRRRRRSVLVRIVHHRQNYKQRGAVRLCVRLTYSLQDMRKLTNTKVSYPCES